MTQMEKSGRTWHGEAEFISKAELLKHIDELALPVFYIDGTP